MNMYPEDKETLEKFFPKLGWSPAARAIIQKVCKKLREKEQRENVGSSITIDLA